MEIIIILSMLLSTFYFSLFIGLSFDLTGSYTASLHICAGIWFFCGILYFALYISYRRENSCNTKTSTPEDEMQTPSAIATSEGYATLLNENVRKEPGSENVDIASIV